METGRSLEGPHANPTENRGDDQRENDDDVPRGAYTRRRCLFAARELGFGPANVVSRTPQLDHRRCAQVALSDRSGLVVMTTGLDTMNRVVTGSQGQSVPSMTLDSLVGDREPSVLKIDVEGHEDAVIAGAVRTLARDSLCAIILEHGESSPALAQVLAAGFTRYQYDPRARSLVTGDEMPRQNSLLVRNSRIADVTSRCRSAPSIDLGWTTV